MRELVHRKRSDLRKTRITISGYISLMVLGKFKKSQNINGQDLFDDSMTASLFSKKPYPVSMQNIPDLKSSVTSILAPCTEHQQGTIFLNLFFTLPHRHHQPLYDLFQSLLLHVVVLMPSVSVTAHLPCTLYYSSKAIIVPSPGPNPPLLVLYRLIPKNDNDFPPFSAF